MIKKVILTVLVICVFLTSGLLAQLPDARRTGEELLYEALLGTKGFFVVVTNNGCTKKESFQVETLKQKNPDGSIYYVFTVKRKIPDECKRMPQREIIYFDFEKDLGITGTFTYSLTNKLFPTADDQSLQSIIENYFRFGKMELQRKETSAPVQIESGLVSAFKEELDQIAATVRAELKQAMIFAVESEIARYQQRKDKDKLTELEEQLKKFRSMPDSEFPLPPEEPEPTGQPLLTPVGPILPPQVVEAQLIVSSPLKPGAILEVAGQTKSGPFYHLAGGRGDILKRLETGRKYPAILCLIYRREYFGQIPDYYVYLAGIKEN